jgi:hypothetical protein
VYIKVGSPQIFRVQFVITLPPPLFPRFSLHPPAQQPQGFCEPLVTCTQKDTQINNMSNDSPNPMVRQHTNDIELGVSDVLQRHITRHVVQPKPVSQRRLNFEHKRPRILREMMAEA